MHTKVQKTHKKCKNKYISSNRYIAGWRGSDIVLVHSFHHIGYPRYYRDILQLITGLKHNAPLANCHSWDRRCTSVISNQKSERVCSPGLHGRLRGPVTAACEKATACLVRLALAALLCVTTLGLDVGLPNLGNWVFLEP
jgi:hypothetical protein